MIGTATANVMQTIGAVLFWVMAWQCLRAGARPTRQPVFARWAGLQMALGLLMVALALGLDALTLDDPALLLGATGQTLCYLAIAVFLWREAVHYRHAFRQARQRAQVRREREHRRRQVARGGEFEE